MSYFFDVPDRVISETIAELARRIARFLLGILVTLTLVYLPSAPCHAQASTVASAPVAEASASVVTPKKEPRNLPSDYGIPPSQVFELGLIAAIGILTLLLQCFLLVRTGATPSDVTRVTLITLIVTLAASILIMGYGTQQIVEVIGLFGSIIGYLLGRGDSAQKQRGANESEHGS
ncbi:Uncharacterised protein [Burkholderia pseudomallei]|uniref:hypothetical protein n=1 Tax=Burkholderia pseudomallei TaxID=28450 RepID=UPI0005E36855|nr:hypothetical protein [Burkholderia pseudomallei]CAJ3501785.1 Uncharacterised protein [Burkholderia pseudomallei]CAJ3567171.1 Uncharacterised protein [Burkholderia pseudomallei]CAJ5299823.1 Uncharacterised protein [Burkholderia pseudomallei]CAJ5323315.1 Uncharacterised protein [Burkholderia pseudomallei]CAJ5338933.1 Uncharacterised protein [Burkholderia pseudomallei]